jgi:ElaB/YqjD/DUF883 family membrane-anchored ribosome-binding protein
MPTSSLDNGTRNPNENLRGRQMANEDSVNSTVQQAMDQGRNIADKASETVKEGYKAAQQYAQDNLSVDVADFVRREPWMAITAAFAIGYVAAQMIRRTSWR